MISIAEYRADPCGSLSIPYHKARDLSVPPPLRIVHQRDFREAQWAGWVDTPYFRLYHPLKPLPHLPAPPLYRLETAVEGDCPAIAELIRLCYGRAMAAEEVRSWRERPVFRAELWLLAWDQIGALSGAAIAEFDRETGEGALEWVQVHPSHRRRGLGAALVSALLGRLAGTADFATVSGEVRNPTAPEALYRRCGFSGQDIWHVLHQTSANEEKGGN